MISTVQQIRTFKADEKSTQIKHNDIDAVIDGCAVRMRFANKADDSLMPRIQDILLSSFFDSICAAKECGNDIYDSFIKEPQDDSK
jgi:hypothetical protein